MSKSKLYNSLDLSKFEPKQSNLVFYTNHQNFNIIRSKFNNLAPCSIKLYDISDYLSIEDPKFENHIRITISNTFFSNTNVTNISKTSDKRYHKNVAWQRHLNHTLGEGHSIGHLRGLGKNIEPIFRDDIDFQFNLDSIRISDVPNHKYSSPSGLTIEEACQIARYIGGSTQLKSFNLVCTQEVITDNMAEAMATILWYLFEGLSTPKNHPNTSTEFSEFIVMLENNTYSFYQSNINGKWWLKIDSNYHPCSHDEYVSCTKGEIPNRLLDVFE